MAQPVKLSDGLVLDARLTGEVTERSIAGQIEFWAGVGRAVERVLRTESVLSLKSRGNVQPLSACLASVEAPEGRERLSAYLGSRPFPHFEAAPGMPGVLVKIDADGTRTLGRFVNREFHPEKR
jgi:hypothetical protein